MRIEWRQPGTTGPPLGALFGLVMAFGAVVGAVWLKLGMPVPACRLRELTGVPCPTCGSTRLAEELLRGHVLDAFAANPLVFLAIAAVAVWAVLSVVTRLLRLPTARVHFDKRERLVLKLAAVAGLVASWAYVILRDV